jgi:uncharacterized RDD family membrane protein YckC
MQDAQPSLDYASPWLRVAALVIDTLIVAALYAIGGGILGIAPQDTSSYFTFAILFSAAYTIGFTVYRAATPGKIAVGVYVADQDGSPVRPDAAILRYLIFFVAGAVFIGHLVSLYLVFADRQHRTLHDRLAKTLVLKGRPEMSEDRWR